MSFSAFLVSLDSRFRFFANRTSSIPGSHQKKISRVSESGFPYLTKREKESLILPAISAGPRNHPTTGIAHADVPAIVSKEPVI